MRRSGDCGGGRLYSGETAGAADYLAVLTVAYLMLRELRDSLQTRGETLIFAKGKALFDGVDFDYGQGIDKDEALFGMWAFDARECRGVMSGRGFSLEEDWLYKAVSARFLCSS